MTSSWLLSGVGGAGETLTPCEGSCSRAGRWLNTLCDAMVLARNSAAGESAAARIPCPCDGDDDNDGLPERLCSGAASSAGLAATLRPSESCDTSTARPELPRMNDSRASARSDRRGDGGGPESVSTPRPALPGRSGRSEDAVCSCIVEAARSSILALASRLRLVLAPGIGEGGGDDGDGGMMSGLGGMGIGLTDGESGDSHRSSLSSCASGCAASASSATRGALSGSGKELRRPTPVDSSREVEGRT
eukprot:3047598-Rhodomonas_salina.2